MLLDLQPPVHFEVSLRLAELDKSHCRFPTRHGEQILQCQRRGVHVEYDHMELKELDKFFTATNVVALLLCLRNWNVCTRQQRRARLRGQGLSTGIGHQYAKCSCSDVQISFNDQLSRFYPVSFAARGNDAPGMEGQEPAGQTLSTTFHDHPTPTQTNVVLPSGSVSHPRKFRQILDCKP